ncbi:Hypothetical predicted protein [Scomber scombrus]|uniref:Uncharacterized protein n=1 Tax=Scomber scombrus TaxID=13677 RepID=A0AAV1PH54_SCOSC
MTQISRHANRISQDLTVCKPHEFTDGFVCVRGLLFPLHESEASRDQGSKSNYATVKACPDVLSHDLLDHVEVWMEVNLKRNPDMFSALDLSADSFHRYRRLRIDV